MQDAPCRLTNGTLTLDVAPLGAEMQSLRDAQGREYLWQGDAAYWTGRAPLLFPIVGRAPGDRIAVGPHEAAMPQHGFARRRRFTLVSAGATACHHVLRDDAETRADYPCGFALHVHHRLEDATLHCAVRVENTGTGPLPFGFGFHPAFAWPLPGAEGQPHEVTLTGGGSPTRRALSDGLLVPDPLPGPFTDGRLVLDHALFAQGALVFPGATATQAGLRYGVPGGPALDFRFTNLPDLALWQPQGAPFLCVEPWHGTASHVGDGPQIADRPNSLLLAPGQAADFAYQVTLTR